MTTKLSIIEDLFVNAGIASAYDRETFAALYASNIRTGQRFEGLHRARPETGFKPEGASATRSERLADLLAQQVDDITPGFTNVVLSDDGMSAVGPQATAFVRLLSEARRRLDAAGFEFKEAA